MKQQKLTKRQLLLLMALVPLAALIIGGAAYVGDYYRADAAAIAALSSSRSINSDGKGGYVTTGRMLVEKTDDGFVFSNGEPKAGFIFYPGGKVEYTAYAPLMRILAEQGVLCVLTDMPLNLAVLDMNAAEGIAEKYPEITRWSIGGHSLGGAMAASYAAAHPGDFAALVLLAAYSTAKLPDELTVVSVYGDADGVMARDKYETYRANLPANAQEVILPGGNHAQFGSYGPQAGDGEPAMTAEAQRLAAAEAILPALTGAGE